MEQTNKEIILEVKNLSVTLEGELLLKNVSFSVEKGEALAIIGPNGAGKSMLLRALLGLVPSKGIINWKKGVKLGYVPQKLIVDSTIPITVREFFLLKSSRFWFPAENFLKHIHHEFSLVGLDDEILEKRFRDLSRGQTQRALIAWAMLEHPDVLLFDEPTAGIDIGGEENIYSIMHKVQDERGTTILLISHDLNVVYRYADNVLCLNQEMICHGKPQELLTPTELEKIYGQSRFYHHIDAPI